MSSKDRRQNFAKKRQGTESMCNEVHLKLEKRLSHDKKVQEEI